MLLPNRGIVAVAGEDREAFLQGLITNDIAGLGPGRAVYACLLTPQGRFLHDFFVATDGERLLLDCEADRSGDLLHRLTRFRLRSKVGLMDESKKYHVHHSPLPERGDYAEISFPDPRHAALGVRIIALVDAVLADEGDFTEYDRQRIALAIPNGSRDMVPEQALLLENNIERLNGIAWNKGCYVGQEVTARMHHRGGVKKRLTAVRIEGETPTSGTPVMAGASEIGEMRSSCGDVGLALLRLDRTGEISCGDAKLHVMGETLPKNYPADDPET